MQEIWDWYLEKKVSPPSSIYFVDAFSDEEVDRIILLGDNLFHEEARIGNGGTPKANESVRKTLLSFIPVTKESEWLFRKLTDIIIKANEDHFNFIIDRIQTLQYSIYNIGDFYGLHIDSQVFYYSGIRKISFSLQLTEDESYEGGDLKLMAGRDSTLVSRKRGTVVLFNSMLGHEVTPVTAGVRKALVGWVTGPLFK